MISEGTKKVKEIKENSIQTVYDSYKITYEHEMTIFDDDNDN